MAFWSNAMQTFHTALITANSAVIFFNEYICCMRKKLFDKLENCKISKLHIVLDEYVDLRKAEILKRKKNNQQN